MINKYWIALCLIIVLLSTIGLSVLTRFSFNAEIKDNIYSIQLYEWESTLARLTMVLMWISLGFLSLLIILLANFSLAFITNLNMDSTIVSIILWICIGFFTVNIMGIIFLSRFCIDSTVKDNIYSVSFQKWHYICAKIAIFGEWLSHLSIIFLCGYFLINKNEIVLPQNI